MEPQKTKLRQTTTVTRQKTTIAFRFVLVAIGVLFLAYIIVAFPIPGSDVDREFMLKELPADLSFDRTIVGSKELFYSLRKVGNAFVENDFVVFERSAYNNKFRLVNKQWRDSVIERLPDRLIEKNAAEQTGLEHFPGTVAFSTLYILSPESVVYKAIDPKPAGPVWSVSINDASDVRHIAVIDATSGAFLGEGVPPPYGGFSFSGPEHNQPCRHAWDDWYENAEALFEAMGYNPTEGLVWPSKTRIADHMRSGVTALYYHLAHGGSYAYSNGCLGGQEYETTYSSDISSWISSSTKWPFAFIGSCDGMCSTGSGTMSYALRKGSSSRTTTVGYCGMSGGQCDACWNASVSWQNRMLILMMATTVKQAFDQATVMYPQCASCVRFAGDQSFPVGSVVRRGSWVRLTPSYSYPPYWQYVDLTVNEHGAPAQMELKRSLYPFDTPNWWSTATDITPSGYQSWAPGSIHQVQITGMTWGQHVYVGLRQIPETVDGWQYGEYADLYFEPPPPPGGGGGGSPAFQKMSEYQRAEQCECCMRTGDELCCAACY